MSISSNEPMNEETAKMMREAFGEPVSSDDKTALFNNLNQQEEAFKKFAKESGQDLKLDYFEDGDIKTLEDGTQYKVTNGGWVKIEPTIENEVSESHQFLDKNIMSFDLISKNRQLIAMLLWAEDDLPSGGGPLRLIIEKGNYEDSDVDFCSLAISDKHWREQVSGVDLKACKQIITLLRPLTPEQREMFCSRTVITDELHNLLYNQCAHGG